MDEGPVPPEEMKGRERGPMGLAWPQNHSETYLEAQEDPAPCSDVLIQMGTLRT